MAKNESKTGPGQLVRRGGAALLVALLALVVGGALSIPFVYESQTLWYKVGFDKTLLRSGQLAGLCAAVSLFVQMLLGVRGRFLEEIFGAARLFRWHRVNGLILVACGLLHATLVLSAEELTGLIDIKSWPELVGALLLTAILAMVVSSLFRRRIGLAYADWRFMHRLLAYTVPVLLAIHVLFVSDSFAHGLPMAGLLTFLAVLAVAILWIKRLAQRPGRA